jgi:hypothetical protein
MARKFKKGTTVYRSQVYKDNEPDVLKVVKARTRTEYLVEVVKDGESMGGADDVGRRSWQGEEHLVDNPDQINKYGD